MSPDQIRQIAYSVPIEDLLDSDRVLQHLAAGQTYQPPHLPASAEERKEFFVEARNQIDQSPRLGDIAHELVPLAWKLLRLIATYRGKLDRKESLLRLGQEGKSLWEPHRGRVPDDLTLTQQATASLALARDQQEESLPLLPDQLEPASEKSRRYTIFLRGVSEYLSAAEAESAALAALLDPALLPLIWPSIDEILDYERGAVELAAEELETEPLPRVIRMIRTKYGVGHEHAAQIAAAGQELMIGMWEQNERYYRAQTTARLDQAYRKALGASDVTRMIQAILGAARVQGLTRGDHGSEGSFDEEEFRLIASPDQDALDLDDDTA